MGRKPIVKTSTVDTTELKAKALQIISDTSLEKGSSKLPKCIFKAQIPAIIDFIQDITVVQLQQNTSLNAQEPFFTDSKRTFMEVSETLSETVSQSQSVPYKLPKQGYFIASNTRMVPYPTSGQNNLFDLESLPVEEKKKIEVISLDEESQIAYFVLSSHRSIYLNDINHEISNRYYCPQYPGYYNISTFKLPEITNRDMTKVLFRPKYQLSDKCEYTPRKDTVVKGSWTTVKDITEDIESSELTVV